MHLGDKVIALARDIVAHCTALDRTTFSVDLLDTVSATGWTVRQLKRAGLIARTDAGLWRASLDGLRAAYGVANSSTAARCVATLPDRRIAMKKRKKRVKLPCATEAAGKIRPVEAAHRMQRWLYGRTPMPVDAFMRLAEAYDLGANLQQEWVREISKNRARVLARRAEQTEPATEDAA
jgi:hypothetical protein